MEPADSSLPVTVIVTVFERTEYLRGAIGSVLAQRAAAAEIVVCDDSASPAIREICAALGPRVEYRGNRQRMGVALSVRDAILGAKYPLVAILNDDDCWEPDFLETLAAPLMRDGGAILSFGDHWIMDEAGMIDPAATEENTHRYGRERLAPGEVRETVDLVLRRNAVPLAMAAVFRRDGVDWTLLTREVSGCYDFWISCLLCATKRPFAYSPVRVSRYRIHGRMATARKDPGRNEPMVYIFEKLLEMGWFPRQRGLLRRHLALAWRACGRDQLRQGDKAGARHYFLRSLRSYPTIKSALRWLGSYWS